MKPTGKIWEERERERAREREEKSRAEQRRQATGRGARPAVRAPRRPRHVRALAAPSGQMGRSAQNAPVPQRPYNRRRTRARGCFLGPELTARGRGDEGARAHRGIVPGRRKPVALCRSGMCIYSGMLTKRRGYVRRRRSRGAPSFNDPRRRPLSYRDTRCDHLPRAAIHPLPQALF